MAELERFIEDSLPRDEALFIPIIDVSDSMTGEKITLVNETMNAVPEQLACASKNL